MIKDIRLDENYKIVNVDTPTTDSVSITSNDNIAYMNPDTFKDLAIKMEHLIYDDWGVKICVIFSQDAETMDMHTIDVFMRDDRDKPIDLQGNQLAQFDFGLWRTILKLKGLTPPDDSLYNAVINAHDINPELKTMIFPRIDLTPIDEN